MSDPVIIALIASGSVVIGQIVNLIVSLRSQQKLGEIHTLTNGNLTKVSTALEVAKTV